MADIVNAAALIVAIKDLSLKLLETVPVAQKDGEIYRIITQVDGEGPWQTFNRRLDILFGEDCRDEQGNLKNIERGKYGLGAVCKYLNTVDVNASWFLAAPAVAKLQQIHNALAKLLYVLYWFDHMFCC
jgi:hypothetical protein